MTYRHLTAIITLLSFSVPVSCHSYPHSDITENEIIPRLHTKDKPHNQPKDQVASKEANQVFNT